MYYPDYWQLVKLYSKQDDAPFYKVFATWRGNFTSGDSWRLNSGITEVKEDDDSFYLYGHSGSCYRVSKNKGAYRTTAYTGGVLGEYQTYLGDRMVQLDYDEAIEVLKMLTILDKPTP